MKILLVLFVSFWFLLPAAGLSQTTTPNRGLVLPQAVPDLWGEDYNNNFRELDLSKIPRVTNATKPTAPEVDQVIVVTDAANPTTCTAGGGVSQNICIWTGSAWVTISGGGGGTGGGHVVQEETTPLTQRSNIRFQGAGVTATDNAGADATDITIPGAAFTVPSNGVVVQTTPGNFIGRTITGTTGNTTITNGDGIAGAPTIDLGATAVQTDQSNTYTTGDQNMALASSFTFPTSTGAAPTANGRCAYDSTGHRLRCAFNGATVTIATTAEIQPLSANLTALSGLAGAAGKIPHFTGPGAMALTTGLETPCPATGSQALNLSSTSPLTFVCGAISTSGLSGTSGKIIKFNSTTTCGDSIMTESGGNIAIAGGLTIGTVTTDSFDPDFSAYTGHGHTAVIFPYVGASPSMVLSTGAKTAGNILVWDANGAAISGGTAGTGTWTDSSTNTGTNKTLVATGAGGTNTITVPIAPYWDAGGFTYPSTSTCTTPVVTQINSGPSAYTTTCTDASTSTFEGNLIIKQNVGTVTFQLTVSDVDSSSHVFGGDFSAMCRAPGATINATWGTSQSVAITMATANNAYVGTTAAVTPNGTCSDGATLFWRFVVNTATFTDDGDTRVIGVLMKQVS